jgi:hypothetical protein
MSQGERNAQLWTGIVIILVTLFGGAAVVGFITWALIHFGRAIVG